MYKPQLQLQFEHLNKKIQIDYPENFSELEKNVKTYIPKLAFILKYQIDENQYLDILNDQSYKRAILAFPSNLVIKVEELNTLILPNHFVEYGAQYFPQIPATQVGQNQNYNQWPSAQQNAGQQKYDFQIQGQQTLGQQPPMYMSVAQQQNKSAEQINKNLDKAQIRQEVQKNQGFNKGEDILTITQYKELQSQNNEYLISQLQKVIKQEIQSLTKDPYFISSIAEQINKQNQVPKQFINQPTKSAEFRLPQKDYDAEILGITDLLYQILFPGSSLLFKIQIRNNGRLAWKQGQANITIEQANFSQQIFQEITPGQTIEVQLRSFTTQQISTQYQSQENKLILNILVVVENQPIACTQQEVTVYLPQIQLISTQVLMNQPQVYLEFKNCSNFDWPPSVMLANLSSSKLLQFPKVEKNQNFKILMEAGNLQNFQQIQQFQFINENVLFGPKFQIAFQQNYMNQMAQPKS